MLHTETCNNLVESVQLSSRGLKSIYSDIGRLIGSKRPYMFAVVASMILVDLVSSV
jgi:hypothetical protein